MAITTKPKCPSSTRSFEALTAASTSPAAALSVSGPIAAYANSQNTGFTVSHSVALKLSEMYSSTGLPAAPPLPNPSNRATRLRSWIGGT